MSQTGGSEEKVHTVLTEAMSEFDPRHPFLGGGQQLVRTVPGVLMGSSDLHGTHTCHPLTQAHN